MSISAIARLTTKIARGVFLAASLSVTCAAAADEKQHEQLVDVAFVTNRALHKGTEDADRFGNALGVLSAGHCFVDVAARSGRGVLSGVNMANVDALLTDYEKFGEAGLVLYIHGYYEDFERSCRRAAVFKSKLKLQRGFLLFSWPANSNPVTYADDVEDMEASTPQLLQLLQQLTTHVAPASLSVIGHSLGTRGLVKALAATPKPESEQRLRDLILIASDMERERFVEALPVLRSRAQRITVLVSDRDLALRVSRFVNGAERLGQAHESPLEKVNVIDVTERANTHLSGHVYHLRNDGVIDELRDLLAPREAPR